jgi:hypothetical protein
MTSTFGSRYVFGRIDQKVLGSEIRIDWTFTPKLTLQAYLQPFVAVGHYDAFKELAAPKSFSYNVYGAESGGGSGSTIGYDGASGLYTVDPDGAAGAAQPFTFGNPDFNYKSLRGTVVLRWEIGRPLYFVWTQNRADYANPGELRSAGTKDSSRPRRQHLPAQGLYRWNIDKKTDHLYPFWVR